MNPDRTLHKSRSQSSIINRQSIINPAVLPAGLGRPCIVLFSGGLDSTTVLALATKTGWRVHALTVNYGQRHAHELDVARRSAALWRVTGHTEIDVDLRVLGGSALTSDTTVPKHGDGHATTGIPVTYVPARNTVLLALALAKAETVGAADIMLGVNAVDYSGYPDCRPEFVRAFESLANLATKAGVEGTARFRIHAPLIEMSKRQIIELGVSLGVDYAATSSCYDPTPDGAACGACDACVLRLRGFADAGLTDPARYAKSAP
jgi:7-cyano-7-deazaguanine synthase